MKLHCFIFPVDKRAQELTGSTCSTINAMLSTQASHVLHNGRINKSNQELSGALMNKFDLIKSKNGA